jgi:metal transporter CNNM
MPPTRSYNTIAKIILSLLPTLSQAIPVQFHPIKKLLSVPDDIAITSKKTPLTETEFYIYLITSSFLVILGGVFAGLTLGLMGQDEVYLKVISSSGTPSERKAANKVLELLNRGKHWLLVTLLLSNVITNETLPVILDRLLGGGFAAVFSSTVAIVIFGEIIPQSICVRYGLELGAFFAPYVLILMYFMYPVAYPIAKLLDHILGQDHGTLYRKSGLKTLVNLHHTMGTERLNLDEVTIISAVLDLKAKPVCEIMTPMEKVYTLPSNRILDEKTVEEIFNAGFSRIPIHFPDEPTNFVGMLLVRILISYDPEDELPISSFPLATLPETSLSTSCLNILNYFQEGKSHMVVISETPGKDTGVVGVLTLEDVIEELIGEEIIDETDVYIDVNKNIKRQNPGPFSKRNVTSYLHKLYTSNDEVKKKSRENSLTNGNAYITKNDYKLTLDQNNNNNNNNNNNDNNNNNNNNNNNTNKISISNVKPTNLAADPLKTSNTHVTIKKQPVLLLPTNKTTEISNIKDSLTNTEKDSLSPAFEKNNYQDYGTNLQVDNSKKPKIHNSEAAAFVQGVYANATRHSSKCNEEEYCEIDSSKAKKAFLINNNGIPVPRDNKNDFSYRNESDSHSEYENSHSSRSGSIGGILVEDNIISVKGVSKTIIHDGTWNKDS